MQPPNLYDKSIDGSFLIHLADMFLLFLSVGM